MGMNKSYVVNNTGSLVGETDRRGEYARGVRRRWSGSGGEEVILMRIRHVSQWI
jgi:hypothetical protein